MKKPVAASFAGARQAVEPLLDVGLRGARGIEVRGVGLGRRAGDERLVVIEAVPRAFVDQEVVQARRGRARRARPDRTGGALRQILEHGVVAGPDLTQEQRVHDARGLDQPRERLALVFGQGREVGADIGRREPRRHLLKLRKRGHWCDVLCAPPSTAEATDRRPISTRERTTVLVRVHRLFTGRICGLQ